MKVLGTLLHSTLREMQIRQQLRFFLALFSIVWGTLTVALLLALGKGFHDTSQANIMQLAEGTFYVVPAATTKAYQGIPQGRTLKIKASTVVNLPNIIPNIQGVSPFMADDTSISVGKQKTYLAVLGTNANFVDLQQTDLTPQSRFFNPTDVANHARVAILGSKLKDRLFKDKPALEQTVFINQIAFRVIGVIQPPYRHAYSWYNNTAIIPYTTLQDLVGDVDVGAFIVLPSANVDPQQVQKDMQSYFAYRYHFDPTDTAAFRIIDTTKMFQFFKWFFMGIQIFLGICGGLTLGVGGLGVANIMFLIVTERTREIGLRMALGATPAQILLTMLWETLWIILLGGVLGLLLAWVIVSALQYAPLPSWLGHPTLSFPIIIATVVILAVIGILTGYFPARRAARMDPVTALGYRH